MKINMVKTLGVMAIAGALFLVGCDRPSTVGQSTGTAIDKATDSTVNAANTAADKTVEVANKAATATKNAAIKAVNKTGDAMVQAGSAMQNTPSSSQE